MSQGETMSPAISDDDVALLWLKSRIEDLSERPPMWSRNAYTHTRAIHVAFCNGAIKLEGECAPTVKSVRDAAEDTLTAIRVYRATIDGPVLLTWRCEPELEREPSGVRVYCRLALEADRWS